MVCYGISGVVNLYVIQALFEGFIDVYEQGMYEFEPSESLLTYFLDLCG